IRASSSASSSGYSATSSRSSAIWYSYISRWVRTETYSPAAIDNAPASSPAHEHIAACRSRPGNAQHEAGIGDQPIVDSEDRGPEVSSQAGTVTCTDLLQRGRHRMRLAGQGRGGRARSDRHGCLVDGQPAQLHRSQDGPEGARSEEMDQAGDNSRTHRGHELSLDGGVRRMPSLGLLLRGSGKLQEQPAT